MKKKLWIVLGLIAALLIGYGTAYAQGIRIQFLGAMSGRQGVYRLTDGPNTCYVAKGDSGNFETMSIFCVKN